MAAFIGARPSALSQVPTRTVPVTAGAAGVDVTTCCTTWVWLTTFVWTTTCVCMIVCAVGTTVAAGAQAARNMLAITRIEITESNFFITPPKFLVRTRTVFSLIVLHAMYEASSLVRILPLPGSRGNFPELGRLSRFKEWILWLHLYGFSSPPWMRESY